MRIFCLSIFAILFAANVSSQAAKTEISGLANNHPDYLALRGAGLGASFAVENVEFSRDAGAFHLQSGAVTFLKPVLDQVPIAVFVGNGEFRLDPSTPQEERMIELYTGEKAVKETFKQAVFYFTDDTHAEIRGAGRAAAAGQAQAADILANFRRKMRSRRENPQSSTEAVLNGSYMDNLDADLLAGLLNPDRPKFFSAYIKGSRFEDLRFHARPFGGVPQMLSPEETALINFNPGGDMDGIWYLTHRKSEHESGTAGADEDKREIDVTHYAIDAAIAPNRDLSASAAIDFEALANGTRVVKFGLLPTLRVSAVTFQGEPTHFVQNRKKEDCGFYVILPEALQQGRKYRLEVSYSGGEVVRGAGGGNFAVGARSSWYPSIGSFRDRATYEMNFRYPKRYVLVAVGNRIEEGRGKKTAFSKWKSDIPLKVAGFNIGDFKKMTLEDGPTGTILEGFATSRAPDILRGGMFMEGIPLPQGASRAGGMSSIQGNMSPKRMMEGAVVTSQGSTQLFTHWFGPLPYGRMAITQQPQFGFGQSWPTLIYLPVSAFLDDTQRWTLLGSNTFDFANFVQQVTPHEVAHQWWGHLVGWATYHDQWISEGFSDFSAGLYLQQTGQHQRYIDFLKRWREMILEKNEYGYSANDVGPLWMGRRLSTPKTASAYRKLIYPKGGFVLHMLRQMMFDLKNGGDRRFMTMMQDFVKTHRNKDASTESFKASVEKHMTQDMDLAGDGKMDWFFNQWVYGNQVPSYALRYTLTPADDGKARLKGVLSQSGVTDDFMMSVPIYVRNQGKSIRIGSSKLYGNVSSPEFDVTLPWMPESVTVNAFHDVLAENVTVQRQ